MMAFTSDQLLTFDKHESLTILEGVDNNNHNDVFQILEFGKLIILFFYLPHFLNILEDTKGGSNPKESK